MPDTSHRVSFGDNNSGIEIGQVLGNHNTIHYHGTSKEDKEHRCLQAIASDYTGQKNFNRKRFPETCEWFFKDVNYLNWRESRSSSLLWLSADPGMLEA